MPAGTLTRLSIVLLHLVWQKVTRCRAKEPDWPIYLATRGQRTNASLLPSGQLHNIYRWLTLNMSELPFLTAQTYHEDKKWCIFYIVCLVPSFTDVQFYFNHDSWGFFTAFTDKNERKQMENPSTISISIFFLAKMESGSETESGYVGVHKRTNIGRNSTENQGT